MKALKHLGLAGLIGLTSTLSLTALAQSMDSSKTGSATASAETDMTDGEIRKVDKDNKKAIHIYEKLGFQVEGVLRQEFFINGQYRDVTRMCLFQQDYLGSRPKPERMLTPTAQ